MSELGDVEALQLYTQEELASILKISIRTLEDWRYHRVGPTYVKLRGRVRYRWVDVLEYLEANTVGGEES